MIVQADLNFSSVVLLLLSLLPKLEGSPIETIRSSSTPFRVSLDRSVKPICKASRCQDQQGINNHREVRLCPS